MAPSGQACAQSVQNRHRPKSSRKPLPSTVMASVGHASAQARHPSGHLEESTTGKPRNRSGSVGTWDGYGIVRKPCFRRASETWSILSLLKVVSAVRQIETLVTEWEVGYLLVAQRHCQTEPVMEGRVHDLVAGETALAICERYMTYLASPTLNKTNNEVIGLRRRGVRPDWPIGEFL